MTGRKISFFNIGDTSSKGGFSIVMLIFGGVVREIRPREMPAFGLVHHDTYAAQISRQAQSAAQYHLEKG